ncbi:helix-turn-helix transcriptional regulator [Chitinophaga filiformis]|uniref:AraC family transcriptional regulator n=1 Tax=Chitinophaga filiformis TaxID=104663 RepID=UPI001F436D60|nr:AraC family transcriptional regulator [Chitinophaga filiformis]MCF6406486.1 helix-turn-helix transcriptional regulator [Chitinophaga filiformis]
MMTILESKTIGLLRDFPELIAVTGECRKEFFKIVMITRGLGILAIGTSTYYIDAPMIVFIHPSDIISWKQLSDDHEGYTCFFRKDLLDRHTVLKTTIEKYLLFNEKANNIIRLSLTDIKVLNGIFANMEQEERLGHRLNEDAIRTYLQLLMIQSARISGFKEPEHISDEYRHVHEFFNLLERETANVNYTHPIARKTAKEFAASLRMHPNYLNTLLKKHTGQNVSTHIRNRLLEEAKILLLQTNWTLQEVGYSIGFAEQPNFSLFFKKNTGITPAEFRRRAGTTN